MVGSAAAVNDGRRPLRVLPYSVNCDTTRSEPPTSWTEWANFPARSEKIRSPANFLAQKVGLGFGGHLL